MFCASPNFLSQPKKLTTFSAFSKTFGLSQKMWTNPKYFGTCKRTRHISVGTESSVIKDRLGVDNLLTRT
jgi:hypothetical protein